MPSTFFSRLRERRVPQYLGLYLGIGWGVVEFVDWLVKRYLLSSSVTDVALVTLLSLAPTAVLLAYTHGAPGKDGWGRAEKVGVPLNVAATLLLLAGLSHTRDVGAATERIVVTDEKGEVTERQVPKAAYRRKAALFFWTRPASATRASRSPTSRKRSPSSGWAARARRRRRSRPWCATNTS